MSGQAYLQELDRVAHIPPSKRTRGERRLIEAQIARELKKLMNVWLMESPGGSVSAYEAQREEFERMLRRKYRRGLSAALDGISESLRRRSGSR